MDSIEEILDVYNIFDDNYLNFDFGLANDNHPLNEYETNEDQNIHQLSQIESSGQMSGTNEVVHYEDVDTVEVSTEPHTPPKRRKGRPKSTLNAEEKKAKQKEVNRKSAMKYRQKQKALEDNSDQSFIIENEKNESLKVTIKHLESQIRIASSLLKKYRIPIEKTD